GLAYQCQKRGGLHPRRRPRTAEQRQSLRSVFYHQARWKRNRPDAQPPDRRSPRRSSATSQPHRPHRLRSHGSPAPDLRLVLYLDSPVSGLRKSVLSVSSAAGVLLFRSGDRSISQHFPVPSASSRLSQTFEPFVRKDSTTMQIMKWVI